MKCGLLNARSVCNRKSVLLYDLIVEKDFDVLFITESWLKKGCDDVINSLLPAGYDVIKKSRKGRSGGGVMVVYKEKITLTKLKSSTKPSSFELMECELKDKDKVLNFALIYRPTPSLKNKLTTKQFLTEFEQYFIDVSTKDNFYILGDFNIHVNDPSDKNASDFLDILESQNYVQLVKVPTHEAGNTLDLVIKHRDDASLNNIHAQTSHLSDHNIVLFDYNIERPKLAKKKVTFRKYKSMDIETFKNAIITSDLTTRVEHAKSNEDKMFIFNETITELLDRHAPLTSKVITIRPDTSWFTEEIRLSKQLRREAEETWRKSKLAVHRELYKRARAATNSLIVETKRKSLNEKVNDSKGNSKQLFNVLNGLMKTDSSKKSLPAHRDGLELAERFNNYFIEKIATIRSNMDDTICLNNDESDCMPSTLCSLTEFDQASVEEVTELIKKAPNKQCKLDVIPTWLLKECVNQVAPAITSIANRSIQHADIPNCFKEALITPLLKKKNMDHELFKNFRPVSNLHFISKLIERLIVKRLNYYMNENHLHTPLQSAYRQSHSTETALLRVHNDIVGLLDKNDNALLLLLDLSAAFDTVDHAILLDRMQRLFGIKGNALMWFSSYLRGRSQRVIINESLSPPTELQFGVPQGSVLGPILFTLYTSPLSSLIASSGLGHHLYADDTQLYSAISCDGIEQTTKTLVACLEKVKLWMAVNKLKFNEEKTELIVFRKTGKTKLINHLSLGESTIQSSDVVRNLGFYFDDTLSMTANITKCCQAVHAVLKMISRIRNQIDEDTCKTLVHALVTSRLDYCNSLLHGLPKATLNRLQLMQNKAARIVTRTKPRDHITPVLKSLHWLPIQNRVEYKIACLAYNCIHHTAPKYLQDLVDEYRPNWPLRSAGSSLMVRSIPRTKFAERSFKFSAPAIWNTLSTETRQCDSLSSFKRRLKTDLFVSAFGE